MKSSPKHHENPTQSLIPSPTPNNGLHFPPPPPPRSEPVNPYPTTFVQADTSSFKQVVQMLTGSPDTAKLASGSPPSQQHQQSKTHLPPIKSVPKKTGSGFKLYERRNSLKNLNINPLNSFFIQNNSGFSPRNTEILSPSILDFPSLVLSPVTPLIYDPFDRSMTAAKNANGSDIANDDAYLERDAEEKAIKEKGFYLHPSPSTTPRDPEPRLLPLFPVTSPRVSGSSSAAD